MTVVSIDRDAQVPAPEDIVNTKRVVAAKALGRKARIACNTSRQKSLGDGRGVRIGRKNIERRRAMHGRENFLQGEREGW